MIKHEQPNAKNSICVNSLCFVSYRKSIFVPIERYTYVYVCICMYMYVYVCMYISREMKENITSLYIIKCVKLNC